MEQISSKLRGASGDGLGTLQRCPLIRPLTRSVSDMSEVEPGPTWEHLGIHQLELESVGWEVWADLSLLPSQPPGRAEGK